MTLWLPSLSHQSRECVSRLSLQESALRREVEEGRDALDKLSTLNSSLASDKRELHKQLLQVLLPACPSLWLPALVYIM